MFPPCSGARLPAECICRDTINVTFADCLLAFYLNGIQLWRAAGSRAAAVTHRLGASRVHGRPVRAFLGTPGGETQEKPLRPRRQRAEAQGRGRTSPGERSAAPCVTSVAMTLRRSAPGSGDLSCSIPVGNQRVRAVVRGGHGACLGGGSGGSSRPRVGSSRAETPGVGCFAWTRLFSRGFHPGRYGLCSGPAHGRGGFCGQRAGARSRFPVSSSGRTRLAPRSRDKVEWTGRRGRLLGAPGTWGRWLPV